MLDMEAIVLAGGLGTRLKNTIGDMPKPMASIAGRPFLSYLLGHASLFGIHRVIMCVGYKHEIIRDYLGSDFAGMEIAYSYEDKPLGTGGAIKKGLDKCTGKFAAVLNGDSFFDVDLKELSRFHTSVSADISVALKPMVNFCRYGAVEVSDDCIVGFSEKKQMDSGLINGGVYILNAGVFSGMPDFFSFENDFLEKKLNCLNICAKIFNGNFIDIGVPEDYERAQKLLPEWTKK